MSDCNCTKKSWMWGGLLLLSVGVVAFLMLRKPSGFAGISGLGPVATRIDREYNNAESWEIEWEDGLPKKVIVHRHAVRS